MMHGRLSAVSLMMLAALATVVAPAQSVASAPQAPQHLCVNATCAPPVSATAVKFHPGHYIWFDTPSFDKGVAAFNSHIAELVADTNVTGILIYANWADFEGPTRGDYSPGVKRIENLLSILKAQSRQLRLMVGIPDKSYGAKGSDPSTYPQYAINAGYVLSPTGPQAGGLLSVVDWNNPAALSSLAAVSNYFGDKYNSEPLLEMWWPMSETSLASAIIPASTQVANIRPFLSQVVTHWPNTLLRLEANWFANGAADLASLYAWMRANYPGRFAIGGPDPEPAAIAAYGGSGIPGDLAFKGQQGGGPDLRGVMAWVGEVEEFGLGVPGASGSQGLALDPSIIYKYWTFVPTTQDANPMKATHMVWNYVTYTTYKWSDEKALIATNDGRSVKAPSEGTWKTN